VVSILCWDELTNLVWVWIRLLAVRWCSLVSVIYPCLNLLLGLWIRIAIVAILLVHMFIECRVGGVICFIAVLFILVSGIVVLLFVSDGSNGFKDRQSTNNVFVD
jgi:hypothetical protein